MTKSKLILCDQDKLLQEEKERLRKLRLLQVREISKQSAARVREAFKKEKEKEIQSIINTQESIKQAEHERKYREMQEALQKQIENIGEGHKSAANYDDQTDIIKRQKVENNERALIRGKNAINQLREEKAHQENKENANIIARQHALEKEKIRSAQIAQLPKVVDEVTKVVEAKPAKTVSLHDANAFMTTRYHMPSTLVDKCSEQEQTIDARKEAFIEENRLKMFKEDKSRTNQERMEKARVRGKHAIEKEILNDNYNDILNELNVLEKADREKRQKELMNIPKEIFLPSWQRTQEKMEHQVGLEREFEKIYADAALRKEEMPEPVPFKDLELNSNMEDDAELEITALEDNIQEPNEIFEDNNRMELRSHLNSQPQEIEIVKIQDKVNLNKNKEKSVENITLSTQKATIDTTSKSNEKEGLSKILDKIRKQREEYANKSTMLVDDSSFDTTSSIQNSPNKQNISAFTNKSTMNQLIEDEPLLQERDKTEDSISITLEEDITLTKSSIDEDNDTDTESIKPDKRSDKKIQEEKKIMRGIMMSSHNVSSLNELEYQSRSIKRKVITRNNRQESSSQAGDENNFQSNGSNQNSASRTNRAFSIDLSHASLDPMVAGPKELFNKNDFKLAIELKQKEILKQQEELEKRLKELEKEEEELKDSYSEKEKEIIKINKKPAPPSILSSGVDSGNDNNYCSDSIDNSSLLTSQSNESKQENILKKMNENDSKIFEYQQALLRMSEQNRVNKPASSQTSSAFSQQLFELNNLNEETKREVLKRFGLNPMDELIETNSVNSKRKPPISHPSAPPSFTSSSLVSSSQNMFQQLICDDKHTVYSSDSGFVSSSNNFNMNYRNKQSNIRNEDQEGAAKSSLNSDVDEYKRRLSSASTLLSDYSSGKLSLEPEQLSMLFGLEFFDSRNLTDVRDSSIEKLIGWSGLTNQQQLAELENLKRKFNNSSRDVSSSSEKDSFFDILTRDKSSQDKSNKASEHDDDSSSHKSGRTSKSDNSSQLDDDEDDDSQALILSLLNSRNNKTNSVSNQKPNQQVKIVDLKRQFIEKQLDAVRKQKEQLEQQSSSNKKQPKTAFSHNSFSTSSEKNSQTTPARPFKFTSDSNSHDLSTIKEVDTPISERNIKLTSNNQMVYGQRVQLNGSINNRSILNDMSSSLALSSSSLENVTQLSDTARQTNQNDRYLIDDLSSSMSATTLNTSSSDDGNNDRKSDRIISDNNNLKSRNDFIEKSSLASSTSTPIVQLAPSQLTADAIRQKQKQLQLFNSSLFEDSSTIDNSSTINETTKLFKNKSGVENKVDYAAMIFDSLLTNNLSISCTQTPAAFQTSNSMTISNLNDKTPFISKQQFNQRNLNINNNSDTSQKSDDDSFNRSKKSEQHKKWFDILASSADGELSVSLDTYSEASIKQGKTIRKKSSISPNSDAGSTISSLSQGEIKSSDETLKDSDSNASYKNNPNNASSANLLASPLVQYPLDRSSLSCVSPSILLNISQSSNKNDIQNHDDTITSNKSSKKDQYNKNSFSNSVCRTLTNSSTSIGSNYSSSDLFSINEQEKNSMNKNPSKNGLFDKFLKNYTSSTSVMDEPEISFASCHTNSAPQSPRSQPKKSDLCSMSTTCCSSSYTQTHTGSSSLTSFSSCFNELSATTNTTGSSHSNASLIQIQKMQLSKQFADVSPIDLESCDQSNGRATQHLITSIIPFELTDTSMKTDSFSATNKYSNEHTKNKMSYSMPYSISSNKFTKEASTILHELIDENEEDDNTTLVERQLSYRNDQQSEYLNNQVTRDRPMNNQPNFSTKSSSLSSISLSESNVLTNVSLLNSNNQDEKSQSKFIKSSLYKIESDSDEDSCQKSNQNQKFLSSSKIDETNHQEAQMLSSNFSSILYNSTPLVNGASFRSSLFGSNRLDETDQNTSLIFKDNAKFKKPQQIYCIDESDDEKNCSKSSNGSLKSCSYCKLFRVEKYFTKDLDRHNSSKLAKNVTQDYYHIDFNGELIDKDATKLDYDLQKAFRKHIRRLRRKNLDKLKNKSADKQGRFFEKVGLTI